MFEWTWYYITYLTETQRLLGRAPRPPRYGIPDNRVPQQQNHDGVDVDCCTTYGIARIFHIIFYAICSLTGQLTVYFHNQSSWRLAILTTWSFIGLVVFVVLNLGSLAFDVYVIAVCPFRNCSYIYSFLHDVTELGISLDHTQGLGVQPEKVTAYEDWHKTVITTASISGLLSYCFMILVLIPQYSFLKPLCDKVCQYHADLWKWCGEKDFKSSASTGDILSPFKDLDGDGEHIVKATHLRARQTFYFHVIFWFNLVMYISSIVVFYIILNTEIASHGYVLRDIDITGLTAQFGSQFCAILSCFIFSKVAYAVSNKCIAMSDEFKTADVRIGSNEWNNLRDQYLQDFQSPLEMHPFDLQPQASPNSGSCTNLAEMFQRLQDNIHIQFEERHHAYLTILQKMDKQYTDMVKASLEPYGTWFAFHWVLYTLTAFMSIAYFAETVTQELYGNVCHHEHNLICRLDLAYILLFTLEHCVLFLYPCFRAASVTAARDVLIKRVSNASWNYIPHTVMDSFIKYLERQKSGFKVSILCAKIQFGYSIAYISIFVGIFGVILKLSF